MRKDLLDWIIFLIHEEEEEEEEDKINERQLWRQKILGLNKSLFRWQKAWVSNSLMTELSIPN